MRNERRRDLMRILHEGEVTRQSEIVEELRKRGHLVTQATVSRDLREAGAIKTRVADHYVYSLPDDIKVDRDHAERRLVDTLSNFAIEITPAHSLVVIQTAPAHAAVIARAIDQSREASVVGTIAGDDTVFVATPSPKDSAALIKRWSAHVGNAVEGAI